MNVPNTLLSEDRLIALRALAIGTAAVPGIAIEVGVYKGGSLAWIAQFMLQRHVFGFDTFQGLPKSGDDEYHKKGEFAASYDAVAEYIKPHKNVSLIIGEFPQTLPVAVSAFGVSQIAFAHLDVDHGICMELSLNAIKSKISPGGVIVIDDYGWGHCPNVKPVVDKFVRDNPSFTLYETANYQATLARLQNTVGDHSSDEMAVP